MVYIVITDFNTFVLICKHPPKYTNIRFKHEVDFSLVKIVITGVASIKHVPKARVSQH